MEVAPRCLDMAGSEGSGRIVNLKNMENKVLRYQYFNPIPETTHVSEVGRGQSGYRSQSNDSLSWGKSCYILR